MEDHVKFVGRLQPDKMCARFLKSHVLIDLKINNLKAENLGQMNLYLNYYEQVVNSEDDGKPIGIILCAEKDNVMLEYALGGLSNNIFASTYTYYIPNKEQLIINKLAIIKMNISKQRSFTPTK